MTFFFGTEIEAKRQVLMILQEHMRNAVTVAGIIPQMIDLIISSDDEDDQVEELYQRVKKVDEDSVAIEKGFVSELMSVGPLLTSREELLRLVSMVGAVIDSIEGSAYRIVYFKRLRSSPKEFLEKMKVLSEKVLETINSLRECIFLLSYNPAGIMEASKKVVKAESEVDHIYRSLSGESLEADLSSAQLLSINEVISRLETAADITLQALDVVTILLM